MSPPKSGFYKCKLDFLEWGKSANRLCYFTDIETDEKFRLSVWYNNGYKPRKGVVSFKEAEIGTHYLIEIREGKNGKLPTFESAKSLND
jgi:hypothetical protein